jgi:uncharacterized repeat protein (TIGR03803 family)
MRTNGPSSRGIRRIFFAAFVILAGRAFVLGQEQVIHNFGTFYCFCDGMNPDAGLIVDAAGNLYGTTYAGGPYNAGTAYELSAPTTSGEWTFTALHNFSGTYPLDGDSPAGSLIFDKSGNLYGTTTLGGDSGVSSPGSAWQMSPPATVGGVWTQNALTFFNSSDGVSQGNTPQGKLAFDGIGNLYGTTFQGGIGSAYIGCSLACGNVFQLTPPTTVDGPWTETVIYNFGSYLEDGVSPSPDLIFRAGGVYGTTEQGGTSNQGTVFRLVLKKGAWIEEVLHDFTFYEGGAPIGGLIFDTAGNLYGTTYISGNTNCAPFGCGSAFELSPPVVPGEPWQETTLYSFTGGKDGGSPQGGLTRDKDGNLFGTTSVGGSGNGVVFKLIPPKASGESWEEVVLHEFGGAPNDGSTPVGKLLLIDGKGLYGVTSLGGSNNTGTIFHLEP